MKNCHDGSAVPYRRVVLLLRKGGPDIDEYVKNCIEEGLEVSCFLGEEAKTQKEEPQGTKGLLLITDDPEAAEKAASQGIAVIGYQAPETEKVFFPAVRYVAENLSRIEPQYFSMVYMRSHKIPMTVAVTERTVIREITVADLPELYRLYEEPGVQEWVEPLYDYEEEAEYTREYIDKMYGFYGYGLWLVRDKESGELIGRAGIGNRIIDGEERQELGYIISPRRQRQGIGYEVSRAVLEYAREELGLRELFLCAQQENEASLRLAQKLGFCRYGTAYDGEKQYWIYRICF